MNIAPMPRKSGQLCRSIVNADSQDLAETPPPRQRGRVYRPKPRVPRRDRRRAADPTSEGEDEVGPAGKQQLGPE